MPKTTSLIPLPGSKRAKKYDLLRKVPLGNLCEPFMGGASTAIMTRKPSILGDVNPWHRGLVKAAREPKDFIEQYISTVNRVVSQVDPMVFKPYNSKTKKAQEAFRRENSEESFLLDIIWAQMKHKLYYGEPEETLGLYSFMQRACFKNTLRLNPNQTALNVSWHVLKIKQALVFDPQGWARDLEGWHPKVVGSYQEAIDLADPKDCHLLLDPPYYCSEKYKITPCYIFGHRDPYGEDCLTLATHSLELGLSKGFPVVHLCNYYSPELEDRVRELAAKHRYPFMTYPMGAFPGNNARLTHGERVDGREKPIEVIWEFIAVQS